MMEAPFLSLILPAYNEVRTIGSTLNEVQAYLDRQTYSYEILVCADGTDGTRELVRDRAAQDGRLHILGSPGRGGKGRGIRLAVAQASGQVIGFADADNKTPIGELGRILPWFDRGYDLVIGSRALREARIDVPQPLYRRLGSRAFGLCMHLLTGLWHIPDTQCGFKFFRAKVARDLFARQRIDGYMFDVEILYLACQTGYRIRQVGVHWRDDGDSRLRLLAGNWQNMVDLFRIRFGATGAGEADSLCSGKSTRKKAA
jgi:glycosyltransferase involved in cell wall biosynthesis